MLEFYHINHPKARKEHVCDLCGSKILLGQTYERYSGKYDGNMFDLKYCLNCEKVIDAFLDENDTYNKLLLKGIPKKDILILSAYNVNECDEYSDDNIYDWLREKFCYSCKHGDYDALDDCTVNKFCCPTILAEIKK